MLYKITIVNALEFKPSNPGAFLSTCKYREHFSIEKVFIRNDIRCRWVLYWPMSDSAFGQQLPVELGHPFRQSFGQSQGHLWASLNETR
jgi:hypothetical protein